MEHCITTILPMKLMIMLLEADCVDTHRVAIDGTLHNYLTTYEAYDNAT